MNKFLRALALTVFLAIILAACGGGGGGSTAMPESSLSVSLGAPNQALLYTGRALSLTAQATSSANLSVTYAWDFGDGSTASGKTVSHIYQKAGTYLVKITATDSNNKMATASGNLVIVDATITTPFISFSPAAPKAGGELTFSASASDTSGGVLTYIWDFGDGSAAASGASVKHTYSNYGIYTVKVLASNDLGISAQNSRELNIDAANPSTPVLNASQVATYVGKTVNFSGTASDPANLPLTYNWEFGDGAGASGASVSHAYAAPGSFTARLTVSNTGNGVASATAAVAVLATPVTNTLSPACVGGNCAAIDASTYGGSGVGAWQYDNAGAAAATLDIAIAGVKEGNVATLVFTNPGSATAGSTPQAGVSANVKPVSAEVGATLNAQALHAHDAQDQAHHAMLERNKKLAGLSRHLSAMAPAPSFDLVRRASAKVGDSRVWIESFKTPVNYTTTVKQVCDLKSGRKAVFWVDAAAVSKGLVKDADILALSNTFCANGGAGSGGFDVLVSLMGDAYGPNSYSGFIQDTSAALQDVNIAVLGVPADTGWAGYFWAGNDYLKSVVADSNEALAFFVNANGIAGDLNFYKSTLMHEAVHMINFYQRSIKNASDHDTWLEETSAMMGEDVLAKIIFSGGYNKMVNVRIPQYLASGGAVSYINWPELSGNNYGFGGSFAAFLNRKYGIDIFKQLVTACKDGGSNPSSYLCLNGLIQANAGLGLADELSKFGASLFGGTPAANLPAGIGFPQFSSSGFGFDAVDIGTMAKAVMPATATALSSGFTATTHTYVQETLGAGKTTFVRKGVQVPAGTTLNVLIREAVK
ncbi:MAG: PKD domain-containing protein [Burkholderiales bacterium]|nr:PKD domain-containing protein [Burkholderiales bacterium]